MKKTFLHDTDLFKPFLLLSITTHFMILGIGGLIPSKAQFAVINAPSSIAVRLVEEPIALKTKKVIKETEKYEEVIAVKEDHDETVEETIKEVEVKREALKPIDEDMIITEESRGAQTEAKALDDINPAPQYPTIARRRGWEGTVYLRVYVEEDGLASHIAIEHSSGYQVLDQAALSTVGNWKFSPAHSGGLMFSSWVTIPVQFSLIDQ
jgi:periplasmic protein TonB